jgi:hypothetical protein
MLLRGIHWPARAYIRSSHTCSASAYDLLNLLYEFNATRILRANSILLVLVAMTVLSSCAGLDVKTIRTPSDEVAAKGFRYYETALFLFVHSDGKGGLAGEIVPLPDTTRERSIRPYALWASNDTTLTFSNGTLSEASASIDQTAVASAAIDSLTKVLTTAAAFDVIQEKAKAPPPYLFKIVVRGNSVTLIGGPPNNIQIVLPTKSTNG